MTTTTVPTSLDVHALRESEFPFTRDVVYLNAASAGPLPERARRAMEAHHRRRSRIHEMTGDDFAPLLDRCRAAAARLVGAGAGQIALGGNTSYGINLAALGLPMERGSCVVVSDREFPANVYPWMGLEKDGVRTEIVPADPLGRPDEARLLERLDRGDVSTFALSLVQFASGYRADLERFGRFCRERGIHFVVDGIQAVGQLPVDVVAAEVDVLAVGGHKWLCGPFGAGFVYVREELIPRLRPRVVGWGAMEACADLESLLGYRWELLPDARRFEVGTLPYSALLGLTESMELLGEARPERIELHLRALLDPVVEWLESRGAELITPASPEHRAGILCFRVPAPERAMAALDEAGIVAALREGAIRLSPHLYNTREEMERVQRILEETW